MPKIKYLSILMPAYNEEASIYSILKKIASIDLGMGFKPEIVIVNDGSTDGTESEVERFIKKNPKLKVIYLKKKNGGKGTAIKKAIKIASGEYSVVQDADLEYDPQDLHRMLEVIVGWKLDVLYGSRFLGKESSKHSYQSFYIGGKLLTKLTNLLYLQRLTDEPTCYKMFKTNLLKSIPLKCKGFEFCPEITAKVAKKGYKIQEVPIAYHPRSIAEGKKINWRDGITGIWTLVKFRF